MEDKGERKKKGHPRNSVPGVQRPITSIELAKKLRLSTTTVSFVLNGLAEEKKIAAKTAQRVRQAAEKYNYIPNPFARSLHKKRSGVVGVIMGDFKLDFVEEAMTGMRRVFDVTGHVPFVATHSFDKERNRKELLSSLARRDEGIVAFPFSGGEEVYQRIVRSGVPLVLFSEVLPGLEEISSAVWDSEAAVRAAMQHLVAIGRKRIAFVGTDYSGIGNRNRFKAYSQVVRDHDLPVRKEWVAMLSKKLDSGLIARSAVDQFFPAAKAEWPDAIFAINDALALPVLQELEHRGIRVPDDVAVMGLQDLSISKHPAIGLSTVREPVRKMGETAARILIDLIEGRKKPPVRIRIPSCEVLIRRTTSAGEAVRR